MAEIFNDLYYQVILDKKDIDKLPSLIHNTSMCMNNIRFVTAVLVAVGELRTVPFSVFNITTKLRKQVNAGELTFTDKSPETIDGVGTYRVDHQEVREIFYELTKNNIITGLKSRDTGLYIEFSSDIPATCTSSSSTVQGQMTRVGQVVQPTPTVLPCDASLRQKVQDYLKGRTGQSVTMKEVQSRFKGVSKTCREWSQLVADIGLPVNTSGTPSFWTTHI